MLRKYVRVLQMSLLLTGLALTSACETPNISYVSRTADPGISEDELTEKLDETLAAAQGSASLVNAMVYGTGSSEDGFAPATVYFAESGDYFGPPESVVSIVDFQALGVDLPNGTFDIDQARVFYIHGLDPDTEELRSVLILDLTYFDGGRDVLTFENVEPIEITDKDYNAVMSGGSQDFAVYSYDISDDYKDLAGVIQLKIGLIDEDGEFTRIGKIGTLVGFELN